jgi:hypothetical protein
VIHPTPPVTTTIPATTAPLTHSQIALSPTTETAPKSGTFSKIAVSNWKNRTPLASPDLHATTAPKKIAQSELPGGSTPPPPSAPPAPSTVDTGSGYPSRIPRNYFGPAIATGNGSGSFGVISRFPFGENYSLRPSAIFGGNGTIIRLPLTYDFVFSDQEPFERNPVVTFHAGGGVQYSSNSDFRLLGTIGVDVNLFEGVALVGSYNTDFGPNAGVNFGLGFEF